MRYADADDSDSATPSMDLVATALVHLPPARYPRPPMLSVKSSTPCLLSPAEYGKYLTASGILQYDLPNRAVAQAAPSPSGLP